MLSVRCATIGDMSAGHTSHSTGRTRVPPQDRPLPPGEHRRRWSPSGPVDLAQSLGALARGAQHTTAQVPSPHQAWITARVDGAPLTARFTRAGDQDRLRQDIVVDAWGPGAPHWLPAAPRWVGAADSWDEFVSSPGFERLLVSQSTDFFNRERYEVRGDELVRIDVPTDAAISIHRDWLLIRPRVEWTVGETTYAAGTLLATAFMNLLPEAFES